MNRLLWLLRRRQGALALWIGVALAAAALAANALLLVPLENRVAALEEQRRSPREGLLEQLGEQMVRPGSPSARLAGFYGFFARDQRLADQLARVDAAAHGLGLQIKRAEYRLNSHPDRKLDRYQMRLPIQGEYRDVRAFIAQVLRDLPTASLDQIQFQRRSIADGVVEAQVSFTFYLSR